MRNPSKKKKKCIKVSSQHSSYLGSHGGQCVKVDFNALEGKKQISKTVSLPNDENERSKWRAGISFYYYYFNENRGAIAIGFFFFFISLLTLIPTNFQIRNFSYCARSTYTYILKKTKSSFIPPRFGNKHVRFAFPPAAHINIITSMCAFD